MRTIMFAALAALAMFIAPPAQAQTATAPVTAEQLTSAFNERLAQGEDLVAEIAAMDARGQFLRQLIIEGFHHEMSEQTRQSFIDGTRRHFDRIDRANSERLQRILRRISWSELTALSPRAADQAFSIISHSNDVAFKRRMIAVFEPLARAREMPGERFAMLVDDVAQGEGRPQVYGTNFNCRDGVLQPNPTEAPDQLNARRAELGMNTIEEYAAVQRQMYGACPTS